MSPDGATQIAAGESFLAFHPGLRWYSAPQEACRTGMMSRCLQRISSDGTVCETGHPKAGGR